MKYMLISEDCIQCPDAVCHKVCPTGAIQEKNGKKYINSQLCIECEVCGSYCKKEAIRNSEGAKINYIPDEQRPVAFINTDFCTGCSQCVEVCPFECLEMKSNQTYFQYAYNARPQNCVACRLCMEVCSDKQAIAIMWPDGTPALNFDKTSKTAPIKLKGAFNNISTW